MDKSSQLGQGAHRRRIICTLITAIGVLAFASTARAVVIEQHPVPQSARNLIGWSGGLVATGISTSNGVMATAITPAPFAVGKSYPGSDSVTAVGLGPNGYPWVAGSVGNAPELFEITPTTAAPQVAFSGGVSALAPGPGGSVWMTSEKTLLRYQPGAGMTSYKLPPDTYSVDISAGPGGSMWFTDCGLGTIGRVGSVGEITMDPFEDGDRQFGWGYMDPYGIAQGPDGALWFTEQNHERIGRMTASGESQEFVIPRPNATVSSTYPQPRLIISGPDDSMWFTDPGDSSIGRVTMSGEITEYPVLLNGEEAVPNEITLGPENVLWFSEPDVKDIGSLDPNATVAVAGQQTGHRARSSRRQQHCRHGRRGRICAGYRTSR
jgi:streptogramin lyase